MLEACAVLNAEICVKLNGQPYGSRTMTVIYNLTRLCAIKRINEKQVKGEK